MKMPPPAHNDHRKWELLAWLFATFFLYYGDRAIFGVLLGAMAESLQLSPRELGLSNTLMLGAIALLMPLAGYVGDNLNRKWAIVFSLTAWSLGTVLTGASVGLVSLILFRSLLTGCGESFYTPAAYSLLAERHRESRGRAMAIHQAALYFGVITSGVAGGWVAAQWGWRWAFFVFGGTGLLLAALLAWRLESDAPRTSRRGVLGAVRAGLAALAGNPAARVFCLCFAVIVCIVNAYITWAPRLL
ncbi:MAG: MFS transporter, partial [Devosia sp.]